MTTTWKRKLGVVAATAVTALSAACSTDATPPASPTQISDETFEPDTTPSTSAPDTGTDSGGPTQPSVQAGSGDQQVGSVCAAFTVGFAEFSPFDFDPAHDWFGRWANYATAQLVGSMQVTLSDKWSWTWEQQRKAFDVRVLGDPQVQKTNGDTVVTVHADRLILGMNETGDKAKEQKLTVTCRMELNGSDMAQVAGVAQSPDGPPRT